MKLARPELEQVEAIWQMVTSGNLGWLPQGTVVTGDDIIKMREFFIFKKNMKREPDKYVVIIHRDDAIRMKEYLDMFDVSNALDDSLLRVLYCSESGYESRDTVYVYYIHEAFACEGCGVQASRLERLCPVCKEKKRIGEIMKAKAKKEEELEKIKKEIQELEKTTG